MLAPDRDIRIDPDPRVFGQFIVTAKGVIRFVGDAERAQIVYYSLINARYSDRAEHDKALQRALQ
jgi:hypothetical protein